MALTTLQVVEQALKEYYLPGLRYQLNEKASPFLAQIERNSEQVVGKDIVMALRYGRVGGIGNRADDGTLPTSRSRQTKQAKWETKNLFARFQITDKTIRASKSSAGAFASLLEQEISDCENDAKIDLSRQVLGDGTGCLCTISSVTSSSPTQLVIVVNDTKFLAEGMILDIYDVSAGDVLANGSELEVIAVDHDTKSVTLTTSTNIGSAIQTGTDFLVVSGNYGLELTGVGAVMTSPILYGLSRTTYPWLKANVITNVGTLSESDIQAGIDAAEIKAGAVVDFIQCSYGVRRAYIELLSAKKQFPNTLELKGGWKAISYNGIPIVADKFMPDGTMDLLSLGDWALYQMSDFEWMDSDGAMLHRVADKAAYEATLLKYCDLGCQRPAGQTRLTGITEA